MIVLPFASGPTADYPLIGWHNLVLVGNVAATSEASGYPASNLVNPTTHLDWRATSTADQYLTVSGLDETFNYVGLAKHNLGSTAAAVSVETWNGSSWDEVLSPSVPPDDAPLMLKFSTQSATQARVLIQDGSEAPRVAVLYLGFVLTAERRIYAGHTPITYGRKTEGPAGYSEGGNYLGRIITRETRTTIARLSLISPVWYRQYFVEFLAAAKDRPFFFAWRPASYPLETGYAWLANDPVPVNEAPSNLIAIELQLTGII